MPHRFPPQLADAIRLGGFGERPRRGFGVGAVLGFGIGSAEAGRGSAARRHHWPIGRRLQEGLVPPVEVPLDVVGAAGVLAFREGAPPRGVAAMAAARVHRVLGLGVLAHEVGCCLIARVEEVRILMKLIFKVKV